MKYLDGTVSDGKATCRFVSFSVKLKRQMEEVIGETREESFSIVNYDVKKK